MTTDSRALCAELIEAVLSDDSHIDCAEIARRARIALAEPDVDRILNLAAIIREVDGSHGKSAAALAEAILLHPNARTALAPQPVPEPLKERPDFIAGYREGLADRKRINEHEEAERSTAAQLTPQLVPEGPSDEELRRLLYYEFTTSTGHGERTDEIGFARAVLAHWGASNLAQIRSSVGDGPQPLPQAGEGEA